MKKFFCICVALLSIVLVSCQYQISDGENTIILQKEKSQRGCTKNYLKPGYFKWPDDVYILKSQNHFSITPVTEKSLKSLDIFYRDQSGAIHYEAKYYYFIDDSLKQLYVDIEDDCSSEYHPWYVRIKIDFSSFYFLVGKAQE